MYSSLTPDSPGAEIILCAVQDSPVSFDLAKTLDKVDQLAREAAEKARREFPAENTAGDNGDGKSASQVPVVVVFPEAFLSAYPRGMDVSSMDRLGPELMKPRAADLSVFVSYSLAPSSALARPRAEPGSQSTML